jgi:hypothetical protein
MWTHNLIIVLSTKAILIEGRFHMLVHRNCMPHTLCMTGKPHTLVQLPHMPHVNELVQTGKPSMITSHNIQGHDRIFSKPKGFISSIGFIFKI